MPNYFRILSVDRLREKEKIYVDWSWKGWKEKEQLKVMMGWKIQSVSGQESENKSERRIDKEEGEWKERSAQVS